MTKRTLHAENLVVMGAGLLMLVNTGLHWYGVDDPSDYGDDIDIAFNAWESEIWAWGGSLLTVMAAAITFFAVTRQPHLKLAGMPWQTTASVAAGLSLASIAIQLSRGTDKQVVIVSNIFPTVALALAMLALLGTLVARRSISGV